ncbi:MAG: glycosyl transferase [Rickettsiales bacterium]|nr:glycosyl transferase [Rickettsiales bacterium]|tara:strand:- start:884 stop:1609 length:726 start_codon:yes stop_codon:yes gene_type:complete
MYVSVLIPAFNERARLEPTLQAISQALSEQSWEWELLVADDGSVDGTAQLVEAFASQSPVVRLLRSDHNQGKGAALARAAAQSSGQYLVYCDADLPVDAARLVELIAPLESGRADVVMVSRWMDSSPPVLGAPASRRLLSWLFRWWVAPLLPAGLSDSQCGFKAFRGDAARELFACLETAGFAFDLELLCRASARGLRCLELPLQVQHVVGSRVRPVIDSLRMVAAVLRIAFKQYSGSYRS